MVIRLFRHGWRATEQLQGSIGSYKASDQVKVTIKPLFRKKKILISRNVWACICKRTDDLKLAVNLKPSTTDHNYLSQPFIRKFLDKLCSLKLGGNEERTRHYGGPVPLSSDKLPKIYSDGSEFRDKVKVTVALNQYRYQQGYLLKLPGCPLSVIKVSQTQQTTPGSCQGSNPEV